MEKLKLAEPSPLTPAERRAVIVAQDQMAKAIQINNYPYVNDTRANILLALRLGIISRTTALDIFLP